MVRINQLYIADNEFEDPSMTNFRFRDIDMELAADEGLRIINHEKRNTSWYRLEQISQNFKACSNIICGCTKSILICMVSSFYHLFTSLFFVSIQNFNKLDDNVPLVFYNLYLLHLSEIRFQPGNMAFCLLNSFIFDNKDVSQSSLPWFCNKFKS